MIYSTKAVDYAIRALVCMARHPHKSMDVKAIASLEELPEVFLAKILQKLKKSGLISSKRGVGGGFVLEKAAYNINMLEVVNAVEGFEAMKAKTDREGMLEKHLWGGFNKKIEEYLEKTTVAKLLTDMKLY